MVNFFEKVKLMFIKNIRPIDRFDKDIGKIDFKTCANI